MDGKKYDGDAPKELIDETSEKYNPDNKDHVRSATVKRYIEDFVRRFGELKASPSKERYEELFDVENMRDYLIFSDVIKNSDGFGKNWQWTTYDGVKWYVNAYDLDMSYGGHWQGIQITPPLTGHITTSTALPPGYMALLYNSEIEERYKLLRKAGIIDVDHIADKLADWTARIGQANYALEYERWPNSPCILNYNDSVDRVRKWLTVEIANMDKVYHYEHMTPEKLVAEVKQECEENISKLSDVVQGSGKTLANTRYRADTGLQEQIDQLSGLTLRLILAKYQGQGKLNARLSVIEEALVDAGLLDESDVPPATDKEITDMLDAIFSGNATSDDIDDDEEFNGVHRQIFLQNIIQRKEYYYPLTFPQHRIMFPLLEAVHCPS